MEYQQRSLKADQSLNCRIRATGKLSETTVACWNSLSVVAGASADGCAESVVSGVLPDQAALMGVVNHLYNLGFVILSVECDAVPQAFEFPDDGPELKL